ncbi:hypothetical protein [Terrabacter sp. NPDC080008]|uniref:hypothetical protein n=1 Tax=Terrabacter sp. NPDC080008 TaxID=3155176 RepID=UPI00344B0AED
MTDRSVGRLALGGLLVLLVVDALLVALAFRPDAAGASAQGPTPGAGTSSSTAASSPTTSTNATVTVVPVAQVIAAADGKRAWRATLGTCADKGASLSVTDDGGRTWTERTAPAPALGRVQPVGAGRGFVIAARTGCKPGEYDTDDGAATWKSPIAVDGGWSRVPGGEEPEQVITPQRPDARPCGSTTVVDLARVSAARAVVVCADGRIVRSTDGGSRWSTQATVKGALSVSARDEGGTPTVYVARTSDACDGVEIAKVTDTATALSCVKAPLDGAEGRVSLSVVGAAGWLAVADTTWRSGSDLATWSATA